MTCDKFVYQVSCNKTWAACHILGNAKRFGGWATPDGGVTHCPHMFGDKACGVGWPSEPYMPPMGVPPATSDYAEKDADESRYFTYNPDAGADVESDGGFISNVVFPKTAAERAQAKTKDCDECYGTGRYKGMGGPCSEGCPAKGEK